MSSPELQRLLRVLEDRDTDLHREDVAWAFESSERRADVNTWVQEYLTPATLLTQEELDLYVHLLQLPRDALMRSLQS